jgi:UDP-3-O-[3-hydroxymyristoyl] N-acetylglucosamine deacetylase
MYFHQRTIAEQVNCFGIGLHSGKPVHLTIKPAPVNNGIKFVRVDLPGKPEVQAHFSNVVDTSLATVIGKDGCIVSTVEHLMACFTGMSIDNAVVEVDAYELPITDGSAEPFVNMIYKAGIKKQHGTKVVLFINEQIELLDGDKSVIVYPAPSYKISCTIEYEHPIITKQTFLFDPSIHSFQKEIASARTFGFFHEVESMKRHGLARGGSLENAVVLDNKSIMNNDGLRYSNEFVRHKILDCIGDFSLMGIPIIGHVVTVRSGHKFNHAFLEKLLAKKKFWETRCLDVI